MKIYLNDNLTEVSENATINSLFESMDIKSFQGIAIAINNQVIPRNDWKTIKLKENDKILLIRASQGG